MGVKTNPPTGEEVKRRAPLLQQDAAHRDQGGGGVQPGAAGQCGCHPDEGRVVLCLWGASWTPETDLSGGRADQRRSTALKPWHPGRLQHQPVAAEEQDKLGMALFSMAFAILVFWASTY